MFIIYHIIFKYFLKFTSTQYEKEKKFKNKYIYYILKVFNFIKKAKKKN